MPRNTMVYCTLLLCLMQSCSPLLRDGPVSPAAVDASILGSWAGTVKEGNLSYTMHLHVERLTPQAYAGTTLYSGRLNCGGTLTLEDAQGDRYRFKERITRGTGCANGEFELTRLDANRLRFAWYNSGKRHTPRATAVLVQTTTPPAPLATAYQQGLQAYKDRDYRTALLMWHPLAEQGDAAAQNALGALYEQGWGVPRDLVSASQWYTKAAGQGYQPAQNNLERLTSTIEHDRQPHPSPKTSAAAQARKKQEQERLLTTVILGLGVLAATSSRPTNSDEKSRVEQCRECEEDCGSMKVLRDGDQFEQKYCFDGCREKFGRFSWGSFVCD
jgi:hypothetical protein